MSGSSPLEGMAEGRSEEAAASALPGALTRLRERLRNLARGAGKRLQRALEVVVGEARLWGKEDVRQARREALLAALRLHPGHTAGLFAGGLLAAFALTAWIGGDSSRGIATT